MWRLILKISAACKLLIAKHALNSRLISLRKLFRIGLYCIFNFYLFIIFIHLFLYFYFFRSRVHYRPVHAIPRDSVVT